MATVKVNSRSPYFITATGAEGVGEQSLSMEIVQVNADGSETVGLGKGTFSSNITLRAKPLNFVPSGGTYTWSGGSATGATQDITFTEAQGGGAAQQTFSYTVSATAPDGTTVTSPVFKVTFATSTQFTATLTITNNILPSFSSAGYTGTVTRNATNMTASVDALIKEETTTYTVTGVNTDAFSFDIALSVASGYAASPALAASTASFSGNFSGSDVSLTSTLTGTLALSDTYILTPSVTSATEGSAFTISLTTENLADDSTVPFAITGVSAGDLRRGSLSGSFQVFENKAEIEFEAIKDQTSEQPFETFTITLSDISPTVSTSVKIYDAAGQVTPSTVLVSPTGRTVATVACADTAAETAYFILLDGQTELGNGVTLFSDQSLETPYASDGRYYKIGSSNNGIIGAVADGRISGYVACPTLITSCNIEESSNVPNTAVVSSSFATVAGPQGTNACALIADTEVYYNGAITEGAGLYTQRASDNSLSAPFGGTDNWYKLILTCSDGTPQEHWANILSYPPGYVSRIFVCGSDVEPTTTITSSARVTISMSTVDGNNQGFAFVSQRVKLVAVAENITNPTYQWTKGSTSGSQSNISGETESTLIINEVGGGGETQTSAGNVFYNCKVSGVGVTDLTATTSKSITWEARPSFTLRFASTASASNTACSSGTTVTIHGDRDAKTAFCVGNQFFANADGTGALSAGTYSDSTSGTNNNYRYIEASGIAGPCINYGCAGEPVSQPTSNIQKVAVRRCEDQTNPGRLEYIIFDNFEYDLGNILRFNDFGQTGGAGCYEIIEIFSDSTTVPSPNFTLQTSDLHRTQPYGTCAECVGDTEVTTDIDALIDPNKYYGAYRLCGSTGGTLTYVVSNSSLPNVFRIGANTQTCRHIVYSLHNSIGDVNAYSPDALVFEDLAGTPFNDCVTCIGGSTAPSATPLAGKRTYEQCDDSSKTIVFGHTDNLTAAQFQAQYPTVAYNGICYKESASASATSTINIDDLTVYSDCDACNAVVNPPTITPPSEPSDVKSIRISTNTDTSTTDACNEIDTFPQTVYYTGIFSDGVYLYSDNTLSTKYSTTTSNQFAKTETNIVFKIGRASSFSDPVAEGQVYDVEICGPVQ